MIHGFGDPFKNHFVVIFNNLNTYNKENYITHSPRKYKTTNLLGT